MQYWILALPWQGYHIYWTAYTYIWESLVGKECVVLHQSGKKCDGHAMGVYRVDDPGVIASPYIEINLASIPISAMT